MKIGKIVWRTKSGRRSEKQWTDKYGKIVYGYNGGGIGPQNLFMLTLESQCIPVVFGGALILRTLPNC